MTLIRLTTLAGEPIYINPAHIVAVRHAEKHEPGGEAVRVELTERSYTVRETLGEITVILSSLPGN